MKLHYQIRKEVDPGFVNFGDDLNLWLWPKLIGELLDENDHVILVGMGTVLTTGLQEKGLKIILGAGTGYGTQLNRVPDNWHVYFVRGPLTARKLGLSAEFGITDPAILVRALIGRESVPRKQGAFMPHVTSVNSGEWESVCSDLGIRFIDPSWPVERTLAEIRQSEWLVTEAMHGAIVADALRIPWKPCLISSGLCEFKWHDWAASIGVEFKARRVAPLWNKGAVPRSPLARARSWIKERLVRSQLRRVINQGQFALSTDRRIEELTLRLEQRLADFRADCLGGRFQQFGVPAGSL